MRSPDDTEIMSENIQVAGIVGSLRAGSYTRIGVGIALEAAADQGADTIELDLRKYDIPLLNTDDDLTPDVEWVKATIQDSDAIILGTPMYHGSYSGVLKNTIDHCGFDEFENKTVGLFAVSGGGFPITALEHLRSVCRSLNAWVLPWEAAIPNVRDVIVDGDIVNDKLEHRVETLGRRSVEYARINPHQTSFEGDQNVGAVDR